MSKIEEFMAGVSDYEELYLVKGKHKICEGACADAPGGFHHSKLIECPVKEFVTCSCFPSFEPDQILVRTGPDLEDDWMTLEEALQEGLMILAKD